MADYQQDWDFLRSAAPELESFLLSNDLYWPIKLTAPTPGARQTPQLSVGNIALSERRLTGTMVVGQEQAAAAGIGAQIAQIKQLWRANWAKKAAREYTSRLKLWQQYVRELRADPVQQRSYYANEVRNRTILTLLETDLLDGVPAHEAEQLQMLDTILHGLTEPAEFVWDSQTASAFPRDQFWFLYVVVRSKQSGETV